MEPWCRWQKYVNVGEKGDFFKFEMYVTEVSDFRFYLRILLKALSFVYATQGERMALGCGATERG